MILERTRVFRVSKTADTPADEEAFGFAADILRRGGLVVFPTETVYGLGANALDEAACKRIFEAKGRPANNPLILHFSRKEDIASVCETAVPGFDALSSLMPAPLTVILPAKDVIPRTTTGGLDTAAVRVPTSAAARRLIDACGFPIAAPSANLSGKPSPTNARDVLEDMDGRADVILDGGDCEVGVESTIVTLCAEVPTLLRPGGITAEKLAALLGSLRVDDNVLHPPKADLKVLSPGMLFRHYAPDKPVTLVKGRPAEVAAYLADRAAAENAAVICYEDDAPFIRAPHILAAGKRGDDAAYAAHLFAMLRDTNRLDVKKVYAVLPETDEGIALAVYNRLLRAAGFRVVTVGKEV